jgi:hypothetical protein
MEKRFGSRGKEMRREGWDMKDGKGSGGRERGSGGEGVSGGRDVVEGGRKEGCEG